LVKTADEFNNLTGKMESNIKAAAMLSLINAEAQKELSHLPEYFKTADAAFGITQARLSDLLTTFGSRFAPVLVEVFTALADRLSDINDWLIKNQENANALMAIMAGMVRAFKVLSDSSFLDRVFHPKEIIEKMFGAFKDGIKDAQDLQKELADALDTPTGIGENLEGALDGVLQDADKLAQKIEDILEDAQQAREDISIKFDQKSADIDVEYQRKALDAQTDYGRKVEDINRDAEREIAALKDKQREDDLKAEEDYQNKLWELRMRYLMDLEEALHARDARQVIRLMKQYAIDKEALERKKGLDDAAREEEQQHQLEDIEIKRQQRLADAQVEYQQKLVDQAIAKQRELDDLNLWRERELADVEKGIQRKLEALIKGWIDEQKITQENAAAVYEILKHYFGPGGMTDALYQYMVASLAQASQLAQQLATLPAGMPAPYWQLAAQSAGGGGGGAGMNLAPFQYEGGGMAEGGSLLATRPTKAIFGDAGPELATFTPLGRIGRNVNKLFGDGGKGGGMDGTIVLDISLSPDLEARIVENYMDGVANIITKVTRSKV